MDNEERDLVFRPGMNQDEQEKTLEELIKEFRENTSEQQYSDYNQDNSNELIRETVDRIIERKLQNAKKESSRISKEIKETIGLENRDLIERTITWEKFINGGTIKMISPNHYLFVRTNTEIIGDSEDTIELCKIFNQIFNKTNNEVLELRKIIRDLNKDNITTELYNSYYNKYESIHDSYNEFLEENGIELVGTDIRLAEEIILNIDSFIVGEDGLLTGNINGEKVEINFDNKLYSAALNAITDFQTSDLLINKYNTFSEAIYENTEKLKDQQIIKNGSKSIRINGNDIDNLKSKETVDPSENLEIDEELEEKENSYEEETENSYEEEAVFEDDYKQKRSKIVKGSKEERIKPSEVKQKLYELKVREKEDDNWSLGRGIYHAGANTLSVNGYRIGYMYRFAKEKLGKIATTTGLEGAFKGTSKGCKWVINKLFDWSGEDKKQIIIETKTSKTDPMFESNTADEKQNESSIENHDIYADLPKEENLEVIESKESEEANLDDQIKHSDENLQNSDFQETAEQPLQKESAEIEEEVKSDNQVEKIDDSVSKETTVDKQEETKSSKSIINENDSDAKKYRTLLDNICEKLEKTETNKEDLKEALTEYGISEESYKESSIRRHQKRVSQYHNEKYTNQFANDLHEKVQSIVAKNTYEDAMRIKVEMEKLDKMHQELSSVKETKMTPSSYLADELNKLHEVSDLSKVEPVQPISNPLPEDFKDELNQLFNQPDLEKGKSK